MFLLLSQVSPLYYNASGKAYTPKVASIQRERLFVSTIITQIGRENKFSADFYVLRTVEEPVPTICKHPYEEERNAAFFIF